MFWADRVTGEIREDLKDKIASGEELVVRDEKTASGHPHVGSLVGVAVHGLVTRVLEEQNIKAKFYYEINDTDAMDGMPVYLDEAVYLEHMGKPLNRIPSPDSSAPNLAEYFARDFADVITENGFHPAIYRTSELYDSGRMNDVIRQALEGSDRIRAIYKEVSGSIKKDNWLPVNVICENCGKVSTTHVTDFDGETVGYTCLEDIVEWAKGCSHSGRVSPFDGNATLPWKVEWAAKFKVMHVSVEGAGKDHTTRGGARDVADHIARDVFGSEPPFNIPYEYLLIGGKKMSSSKGNATTAREVTDLLPPHILKLALIGREINRQTNFDSGGDSVPLLFDKYDRLAEAYWNKKDGDDARTFELIHGSDAAKLLERRFLPRFSLISFLVQMPHVDLQKEVREMKGENLTEEDEQELLLRSTYAKKWLEEYAPEEYIYKIQETLPESAKDLSDIQKKALAALLDYIEGKEKLDGKKLHERLHEIKEEVGIPPKELFSAIYRLFLDRDSGPQAGWFLSTLERDFFVERLKEVL